MKVYGKMGLSMEREIMNGVMGITTKETFGKTKDKVKRQSTMLLGADTKAIGKMIRNTGKESFFIMTGLLKFSIIDLRHAYYFIFVILSENNITNI